MFTPRIDAQISQVLARADLARTQGNEGKARVCARRAAGIALRELFDRRGEAVMDPSAYMLLKRLETADTTPQEVKNLAAALLTRVTTDYRLPGEIDLIAHARQLIAWVSSQIQGD